MYDIRATTADGAPTLCGPVPVLRELTLGAHGSMDMHEWVMPAWIDAGHTFSADSADAKGQCLLSGQLGKEATSVG